MRRVSASPIYVDFYYPLNVFMHILTHEEGAVTYLHYGIFENRDEPIGVAQERSTELVLERLPPPPARILEVGIGLATTLRELARRGYDAEGITPDEKQIAMVRARHGDAVRAHCAPFETFEAAGCYDLILFQESSQYIDSEALFAKAETLSDDVLVVDEFALRPPDGPGLHPLAGFLAAAARHRYDLVEDLDLSSKAAPTMDYFATRIPRYRERLVADLGLTEAQIDELIASGARYRELYANGTYGYRLLRFRRGR
jgi:SAM-dependent methyltransferase